MIPIEQISKLSIENEAKIIYLVIDGLGGLPSEDGKTELEFASTPELDKLAGDSICGLSIPISFGITPGSGPGHLSLFGYDPLKYEIGRGALSAAGIGFHQGKDDLAARINFATMDSAGRVSDRRAGRIPTTKAAQLCRLIEERLDLKEVKVFIRPEKEHRGVVIFRGKKLSDRITDSDPQISGISPLAVKAKEKSAQPTAKMVNQFLSKVKTILKNEKPANIILMRGFAKAPHLPRMKALYKLNPAVIAGYPMYKGIARLLGMEVLKTGESIAEEFETLEKNFSKFNFFFVHIKGTDSAGEDGDFKRKVKVIEEVDGYIAKLRALNPQVLVVAGDHSTPAALRLHSWHPSPFLLHSKWCRRDEVRSFSEKECLRGGLGLFSALDIMPLVLANAGKLKKLGA